MPKHIKKEMHFYPLTVSELKPLTNDSVMITFHIPTHLQEVFSFIPGQYLTLRTTIDGKPVSRCYSICRPVSSRTLSVAVRGIPDGVFSTFATTQIKEGDLLEVMPPMGRFQLQTDVMNRNLYIGVAGGSGITPIMSMLTSVLDEEPQSQFVLFYANRSEETMMFRDELKSLAQEWRGQLFVLPFFSSHPDQEQNIHRTLQSLLAAKGGALNVPEDLKLPSDLLTCLRTLPDLTSAEGWYLCGPQGMTDSIISVLKAGGIADGVMHRELFTAALAPETNTTTDAEALEENIDVEVTYGGQQIAFKQSQNGDFVLNEALKYRDDLPHACQLGACGTCKAKVVEGTAQMSENMALDDDEVRQGYILTCQAKPTSDVLKISFDD